MTVQEVREEILKNVGKRATIKYNLGRNKYEKYDVTIKETYNFVFVVTLNNEDNPERKSFSYSDVIAKTIKIDY